MKKIENIWRELEHEQAEEAEISYKRYSPAVMSDLFIAVCAPNKERGIAFLVKKNNVPNVIIWSSIPNFKIQVLPDKANPKNVFVLAKLLDPQFNELFAILCEDLIFKVFNTIDEIKLINLICTAFKKWKNIFDGIALNGLSERAQERLYGELYFLRKLLQKKIKHVACVESWHAPLKSHHDFQHADWAVEVKTTQDYENQEIQITSEKQLDNTLIPTIYVVLLSMDINKGIGESLLDIVKSIREILSKRQMAINAFEMLLHEADYYDIHSEIYQIFGYGVRKMKVFFVEEDFPRIMTGQLAKGVQDVKYTIFASDCEPFSVEEFTFFQDLKI